MLITNFRVADDIAANAEEEEGDVLFDRLNTNHNKIRNEPPHDKTNKMNFAPSEDSDQPGIRPV